MSRRPARWLMFGMAAVAALGLTAAFWLPYLPVVHGTDADEVASLVEWLDIGSDARVADFGAGDGRFALALAGRVGPAGRIYATELSAADVEEIRRAAERAGLDNVTAVQGEVSRTNLPDACCDGVFSRNVYHHLTEPGAINADIHRALRPGGRLLVIDFEPGGPLDRIAPADTAERHGGHGTPKGTVIEEVTAAGFRLVRGPEPWRGRLYAVLFERID